MHVSEVCTQEWSPEKGQRKKKISLKFKEQKWFQLIFSWLRNQIRDSYIVALEPIY